jgi:hypothetical protein
MNDEPDDGDDQGDGLDEVGVAIYGLNRMATTFLQLGADVHGLALLLEAKAEIHDNDHLARMQALSKACKEYLEVFEKHFSRLQELARRRPQA